MYITFERNSFTKDLCIDRKGKPNPEISISSTSQAKKVKKKRNMDRNPTTAKVDSRQNPFPRKSKSVPGYLFNGKRMGGKSQNQNTQSRIHRDPGIRQSKSRF
ncbi:hypothetical protein CEXT_760291 [Caerostris extrusa]|uniref:Uncharacterized protein n=1 Tax=Caerostris extrusa TaxID=172846 RepID=A0AAV4QYU4_CAEEX|nr:hypothetical protein CEXT_760291 [Caerostris extrusa]